MLSVRHPICALLIAGLAACSPTPTAPAEAVQEAPARLWTTDTRAILTADAARALANQCSRAEPGPIGDVWTPTDADIESLEDDLLLLVARKLEETGQSPSPGGYYRQYAGYVIGGRRIIYVNGVDESAINNAGAPNPQDWRTTPVHICDGGPITFGAEYDPRTRAFTNFAFNGGF